MLLFIFLGTILIIGIAVFKNNKPKIDFSEKAQIKSQPNKDNPYMGLRSAAFSYTPEQIGLQISNDKRKVYAIIADLDMGGATATVTNFMSGDASIYLSTGGGFIGAGKHESVKNAVIQFIELGNSFEGKQFGNPDLPSRGNVNFYLLSNKGRTLITESIANLNNGNSQYSKLFIELNKVMNEIRIKSGQ